MVQEQQKQQQGRRFGRVARVVLAGVAAVAGVCAVAASYSTGDTTALLGLSLSESTSVRFLPRFIFKPLIHHPSLTVPPPRAPHYFLFKEGPGQRDNVSAPRVPVLPLTFWP